MAVRNEHEVAPVDFLQKFRGDRVVHHPGIDVDLFALCASCLPGTMSNPREADLSVQCHAIPPSRQQAPRGDRKSTRLNSSHQIISYAVFCLKKKKTQKVTVTTCRPTRAKHNHARH